MVVGTLSSKKNICHVFGGSMGSWRAARRISLGFGRVPVGFSGPPQGPPGGSVVVVGTKSSKINIIWVFGGSEGSWGAPMELGGCQEGLCGV